MKKDDLGVKDWGYLVELSDVDFFHYSRIFLSKRREKILLGFSHTFPRGTMSGITGPSGCGKTTLLKLLAQFYSPCSGLIHLNGKLASEDSRSQTSYLPQDDILPLYLGVEEVFNHHARIRYLPSHSSKSAILLESLGLNGLENSRIGQLSGGQRKRVSIGLELLRKPRLLLLDEPTASLDPGNAHIVMNMLHSIRNSGVTIIVITHRASDLNACDHHLEMPLISKRLGTGDV